MYNPATNFNLAALAIREVDIFPERISLLAAPRGIVRGRGFEDPHAHALSAEPPAASPNAEAVRAKFLRLARECKYDDMVVFATADGKLAKYAPPTGFAALLHEDTTFKTDMIDRHLFRGVARKTLPSRSARLSARETDAFVAHVNARIPDVSPAPALLARDDGDWTASLGAFGWVGLYETRVDARVEYSVAVVAGLDEQTFEEMAEMCREANGRETTREVWYSRLCKYREIARENRRRILSIAAEALGAAAEDAGSEAPRHSVSVDEDVFVDDLCEYQSEEQGDFLSFAEVSGVSLLNRPSQPAVHGTDAPADAPADGFDANRAMRQKRDKKRAAQQFVRLAGCSDAYGTHAKLVDIRGPLDPIVLYRPQIRPSGAQSRSHAPGVAEYYDFAGQCYAYPSQAPPETGDRIAAETSLESRSPRADVHYTWLHQDAIPRNLLVDTTFPPAQHDARPDPAHWTSAKFDPVVVRVSYRDHDERYKTEVAAMRRVVGFQSQPLDI